jgi:hypothetical protein
MAAIWARSWASVWASPDFSAGPPRALPLQTTTGSGRRTGRDRSTPKNFERCEFANYDIAPQQCLGRSNPAGQTPTNPNNE